MLAHFTRSVVCVAVLAVLSPGARAEDAPAAPTEAAAPTDKEMLLLRNGQILEGRITQAAGMHIVAMPGGQIRVKDADVEMVCGSLEEAYQRKRASVQAGDAYQRLELAQWCLRRKLLGPAANEIAEAAKVDPNNPMIGALRHRLELAQQPLSIDESKPAPPMYSNDELDRMVRSLPRGSVEAYTQSVQPVLMNSCLSAGCHSMPNGHAPQLARIPLNQTASRRVTQRNLYALLKYIDRDRPAESPLLKAISEPHGTAQTPVFSEHQAAQFQRIAAWVNSIAHRPELALPRSVVPSPASGNPAIASPNPLLASQPRVLPRDARKASPIHTPRGDPAQRDEQPASPAIGKPQAESLPRTNDHSADPFDPEAFNSLQNTKPAGEEAKQ